jgi:hypothetical protein
MDVDLPKGSSEGGVDKFEIRSLSSSNSILLLSEDGRGRSRYVRWDEIC